MPLAQRTRGATTDHRASNFANFAHYAFRLQDFMTSRILTRDGTGNKNEALFLGGTWWKWNGKPAAAVDVTA